MNTILGQFLENELNAYITDQRLIPQDNLVRLIAKAFEAYDQYRRLVSTPECSCKKASYRPRCKHGMDKQYACQSCIDDFEASNIRPMKNLHPRINERLDHIDANLHACPDLDQEFSSLEYCKALQEHLNNEQNL